MSKLNTATFDNTVNSKKYVIVKYGAEWCTACEEMNLTLQEFSQLTEVPIFHVDVDESPELKELAKIKAIPMTLFYKEGKAVEFVYGDVEIPKLQQKLRMLLAR